MMPPRLTLQQFHELASADAQVLMGRELTDGERRIAAHTVETMHAVMLNLIDRNKELAARLQSCEDGETMRREMGVVA